MPDDERPDFWTAFIKNQLDVAAGPLISSVVIAARQSKDASKLVPLMDYLTRQINELREIKTGLEGVLSTDNPPKVDATKPETEYTLPIQTRTEEIIRAPALPEPQTIQTIPEKAPIIPRVDSQRLEQGKWYTAREISQLTGVPHDELKARMSSSKDSLVLRRRDSERGRPHEVQLTSETVGLFGLTSGKKEYSTSPNAKTDDPKKAGFPQPPSPSNLRTFSLGSHEVSINPEINYPTRTVRDILRSVHPTFNDYAVDRAFKDYLPASDQAEVSGDSLVCFLKRVGGMMILGSTTTKIAIAERLGCSRDQVEERVRGIIRTLPGIVNRYVLRKEVEGLIPKVERPITPAVAQNTPPVDPTQEITEIMEGCRARLGHAWPKYSIYDKARQLGFFDTSSPDNARRTCGMYEKAIEGHSLFDFLGAPRQLGRPPTEFWSKHLNPLIDAGILKDLADSAPNRATSVHIYVINESKRDKFRDYMRDIT